MNYCCRSLIHRWTMAILVCFLFVCSLPVCGSDKPEVVNVDSESNSLISGSSYPYATQVQMKCPPCDRLHCTIRQMSKLKCPGGKVRDVCDCCPQCAKLEGEKCGGVHIYLGKCDRGLVCVPNSSAKNIGNKSHKRHNKKNRLPPPDDQFPLEGVCRQKRFPEKPLNKCYPECTASYCHRNKDAICSARNNAEKKQSCQLRCQHTSCSACIYVRSDAGCDRCGTDDLACLEKFGQCVRDAYCPGYSHSCHPTKEHVRMKFRCLVPGCLNAK